MKQVIKLNLDSIDFQDNRFNFKLMGNEKKSKIPNSLPLFWRFRNRYIPCSNFFEKAKTEMLDVLVYADHISYEDVLKDIVSYEDLSVFEIAKVLDLLEIYVDKLDKIHWANYLNIPFKDWDRIKKLTEFSLEWKTYFISKNTPLKRILSFDNKDLRKVLLCLIPLNPGINIMEQIAGFIKEICLSDNLSFVQAMDCLKLQNILSETDKKAMDKLNEIRSMLFTKRYPTISEFRDVLKQKQNRMSKIKNLQLGIDENFETPGIELKYLMTNKKDIDNLQQWIASNTEVINSILDLQKGNK